MRSFGEVKCTQTVTAQTTIASLCNCEPGQILDSYGSEQKATIKSIVSEPRNSGERN